MERQQRLLQRSQAARAGRMGAAQINKPGNMAGGPQKGSTGQASQAQQGPMAIELAQERDKVQKALPKYREEYGFKMSNDQYKGYKEAETKWDTELAGYTQQLEKGQADIDAARKGLNAEKAAKEKEILAAQARLDKAAAMTGKSLLEEAKKGFMKVQVVGNGKVEGTYYLPKPALASLQAMPYEHQTWRPEQNLHQIDVKTSQGVLGKELHEALSNAQKEVEISFLEKAMPQLAAQKEAIRTGYDTLNTARANLINAYNDSLSDLYSTETTIKSKAMEIDTARKSHYDRLAGYKADYKKSLKGRRALMGANN